MNVSQIDEVFAKLSPERLQVYVNVCQDKEQALCLYQKNLALSAECITPLQVCEVVLRTAVADAITFVHGNNWFKNQAFINSLRPIWQDKLTKAVGKLDKGANQAMLIPNLSFAFWQSFLTKRLDNVLWNKAFFIIFKHAPNHQTAAQNRLALHQMLETFADLAIVLPTMSQFLIKIVPIFIKKSSLWWGFVHKN